MSSSVSAAQVLAAARSALPSIRGVIPLAVLLVFWQVIQSGPSPFFPAPSRWLGAIAAIPSTSLREAIAATLASFVIGMGLATFLGGALGIFVGYSDTARRALNPVLEFMRALPPPTIVPIAVLLIGYEESMKLTVITLSALWPILLNAASAVRSLNKLMLDVSATLQLSNWQTIMKIVAPSAIPGILVGVRIAIPLALVVALLVEMLTSITGLGSLIIQAQRNFNAAQVYGLLVLIGILGFVFNLLFEIIESVVLLRWPPRVRHES
jgi:ABC-type nitrate/sulfonate/bicarbonate transport system permease component